MTVRFVTEETLRDAIGDANVDPDALGQALEDAESLYSIIAASPWLTEASLRSEAEAAGIGPDRVNAALNVLRSAGRVLSVSLTAKQIPEPVEAEPEQPPA